MVPRSNSQRPQNCGSEVHMNMASGYRVLSVHRRRLSWCTPIVLTTVLLTAGQVLASTELPSPYDARSVGMGGAGIASVHNAAAIYHNPAALHEVQSLAA